MSFDPILAEQRFGYGLGPRQAPPRDVAAMLEGLRGVDQMAQAHPLPDYATLRGIAVTRRRFVRFANRMPDSLGGKAAGKRGKAVLEEARAQHAQWFAQVMLRRIGTPTGFRERLAAFWADHLTAQGKNAILRLAAPVYVDEAIRPHLGGRFADLLIAATTHPLMLHYLDQDTSTGPNSRAARFSTRPKGLNENLAREVLELHTLGVGGPYTQNDVRQLAELLTGLGGTSDYGFKFRPNLVEPGAETVLGKTYSEERGMAPIRAVLEDLATHPVTARHIARKLVVHFVSDSAPEAVVAAVEAAFLDTGGDLMACYAALLAHPRSWAPEGGNIRQPEEFIAASLRALDPPGDTLRALDLKAMRNLFLRPLKRMGQPWLAPLGPDGFAEEDSAWVTPQGISARLEWAMNVPGRLMGTLPEPAVFAQTTLGTRLPESVAFAARAAETRAEGIGLVLCAPAFQRR